MCLSGSIYAFKQQIQDFIDRDLVYVEGNESTDRVSLNVVSNHFKTTYGTPTSLTLHHNPNRSIVVSSFSRNHPGVTAYYHPFTGRRLGVQNENSVRFFAFILDLHRFLLIGETGKLINGMAVLAFVFMLFSGFILWWPKKLKHIKQHLSLKLKAKFYRINYDLHRVLGFYAIPLLLFMAITGLYVSFHWFKNAVIVGLGGDSIIISDSNVALKKNLSNAFNVVFDDLTERKSAEEKQDASLQDIISTSKTVFPSAGQLVIQFPTQEVKLYSVTLMKRVNGFYVPERLELGMDGTVQKKITFSSLALNEQFKVLAKPLHTGEIMGLPSIIVYFLFSLIGCSLPVTGFIIWWKKVG